MKTITCHCGKTREMAPSHLARLRRPPTCSTECRRAAMRGAKHWNWLGGRTKDTKRGYIRVFNPATGKYDYEHRLKAERRLKRKLLPGERVRRTGKLIPRD